MTRILQISPEGVDGLRDAQLTAAQSSGMNQVIVLNDHYSVASDSTYTNTE